MPDSLQETHDTLRGFGYSALAPGPRLVVLGGVHGDETCGTRGIEQVMGELDGGQLRLLRGHLTLLPVANPLARRRMQREGERNLNRSFQPSGPDATFPDYETRITDALCPLLAAHDVLLDLHSFESEGDAFAMIGPRDNTDALEPFASAALEGQLALHLGTTRVVEGWLQIYADALTRRGQPLTPQALRFGWGTNEFMRSRGGYGVTLECGQHRDPRAPEVARRAIHAALRLLGMVDPSSSAPDDRDQQRPLSLLRLCSVTDRDNEADRFVREWATFDAVAAGERIAVRADGVPLRAEQDGFIVFPNDKAAPGAEWFYFAVASDRAL